MINNIKMKTMRIIDWVVAYIDNKV